MPCGRTCAPTTSARSRGCRGTTAFGVRLERFFTELRDPLVAVYGADPRLAPAFDALLAAIARAAAERAPALRRLDHEREITPDWLHREQALGYVAYADRFAGTLAGVRERLPYLRELGVTYLHLMPLLHARPEPNDGGYAVVDYGAVEPALGTLEDLAGLASDLRSSGMALCIDVVLNHTAREHAWARAAMAGDADKLAYYRTFADRAAPDAYERTLPEVFPATAPGNFTWEPALGRWVWTTFNPYQWDLDYANPAVFVAMAEAMLRLANAGVDVLRLDAVPFLWKREGTASQNLPEVHQLLQAFRAVMRIAAPGVAFKAEAIVSPRDLVGYLGTGRHEGKECDLAYHNVLMVLLWSTLASGRVALLTATLAGMPPVPPGAGWVTYVRCHDDIGWAVTEEDAARSARTATCTGASWPTSTPATFPGTFARGARFQPEPERRGADERHDGLARRPRGRAGARRRPRAGAGGAPHPAPARGRLRPRRPAAHLHGRRAGPAQRPRFGGRPGARATTTAGCTGRRWTGRRRSAAPTPRASRAGCGPGCARSRPSAAPAARRTPRAASSPVWTGNDHVFGLAPRARGRPDPAAGQLQRRAPSGSMPASPATTASDARGDTAFLALGAYEFAWLRN